MKSLSIQAFLPLIVISALSGLFIGCDSSAKKAKNEDVVLKSYRLIDEQRTDEAIKLLESELEKDPDNYEYKVTLASAYAHKGGIKVQKFVPAISQVDKLQSLRISDEKEDEDEHLSDQVNSSALSLARLLTQFSQFFQIYALIPVVTTDQATYLKHAVYLLNETENHIRPEDALYRAVLGIIIFKHRLAEGFIGEFARPKNKDEKCRLDLGNVNDSIIELGKTMVNILNDISIANEEQAEEIKSASEEVADTVSNLTLVTTSLIVIDEASSVFLRHAAIQHGFGKIIKCGGN